MGAIQRFLAAAFLLAGRVARDCRPTGAATETKVSVCAEIPLRIRIVCGVESKPSPFGGSVSFTVDNNLTPMKNSPGLTSKGKRRIMKTRL